jgi:peptidoglycan/xylan/chitin deacetylase (PgdA/CDA1 family)
MRTHLSRLTRSTLVAALALCGPTAESAAQVIKSGPNTCRMVALTFDLCPVRTANGFDAELINVLVTHRTPATFFMSGRWIAKHDRHVRQLLAVPFFEIGTHGEVHAHLPMHAVEDQRREILAPVTLLKTEYAHEASLFRPPYGEYNDMTVEVVKSLGLRFILWNIESGDPDPALSADQILERVTRRVKPGSVIVFHANGKGTHTKRVIEELALNILPAKGLKPVTVSELLSCDQKTK